MEIALAVLSLVVLALLLDRFLAERRFEHALAVAAVERRDIVEQAADERRELLTRIQHPQVIVEKRDPTQIVEQAPEEDDYDLVGVAQTAPPEADPGDEGAPS